MIGQTLGSYSITRELGRGGMGAVYEGAHTLLGRKAAIKVLLPAMSREHDVVQRFFNEARAATAVKHPGIVEIYDFGFAADGAAFIVMELLDGEPLSARLRRSGRVAPAFAVAVARQIASALAVAHAAGIVHRDLKPDNVFLVPDAEIALGERVKLLDFGIAKLLDDGTARGDAPTAAALTSTGAVMGTPYYMSPEQCRGAGQVDARADLYALGCILFEALCGRVPFLGAGAGEIIGAHLHVAPPRPRALVPQLDPAIEALVLRLLAKDPDDRPASADDVAGELTALARGRATVEAAAAPPDATDPMASTMAATNPAPVTTLGAASGARAANETTAARRRRRAVLVAGGGIAIVGASTAVIALSHDGGAGTPRVAAVAESLASADAAPPADAATPADAAVLYDRVYLELGGLKGKTQAAARLIPDARASVQRALRSDPYILVAWPGGVAPTAAMLDREGAHGFALDATLTVATIRDPQQPGLTCSADGMIASFPDRVMLGMVTGRASIDLASLDETEIERAARACLDAVIEEIVARKVIPHVRQRALTRGHGDEAKVLLEQARRAADQGAWAQTARLARGVLAIDPSIVEAQELQARAEGVLDAGVGAP